MIYPVVLRAGGASGYDVNVPDLPACSLAAASADEALVTIREAIELHLESLIEQGRSIPIPGTVESHLTNPAFDGGTWALVKVDEASLRVKVIRINITLPERVLDAVDQFAAKTGETRSGLLAKAAIAFIGREDQLPAARRGRPPEKRRAPVLKGKQHPAKDTTKPTKRGEKE